MRGRERDGDREGEREGEGGERERFLLAGELFSNVQEVLQNFEALGQEIKQKDIVL